MPSQSSASPVKAQVKRLIPTSVAVDAGLVREQRSLASSLATMGGIQAVLILFAHMSEAPQQTRVVELVRCLLRNHAFHVRDLESIRGYEVMACFMRKRGWVLSVDMLRAVFRFAGVSPADNLFCGGVISNLDVVTHLILDWRIWRRAGPSIQRLLFDSLVALVTPRQTVSRRYGSRGLGTSGGGGGGSGAGVGGPTASGAGGSSATRSRVGTGVDEAALAANLSRTPATIAFNIGQLRKVDLIRRLLTTFQRDPEFPAALTPQILELLRATLDHPLDRPVLDALLEFLLATHPSSQGFTPPPTEPPTPTAGGRSSTRTPLRPPYGRLASPPGSSEMAGPSSLRSLTFSGHDGRGGSSRSVVGGGSSTSSGGGPYGSVGTAGSNDGGAGAGAATTSIPADFSLATINAILEEVSRTTAGPGPVRVAMFGFLVELLTAADEALVDRFAEVCTFNAVFALVQHGDPLVRVLALQLLDVFLKRPTLERRFLRIQGFHQLGALLKAFPATPAIAAVLFNMMAGLSAREPSEAEVLGPDGVRTDRGARESDGGRGGKLGRVFRLGGSAQDDAGIPLPHVLRTLLALVAHSCGDTPVLRHTILARLGGMFRASEAAKDRLLDVGFVESLAQCLQVRACLLG